MIPPRRYTLFLVTMAWEAWTVAGGGVALVQPVISVDWVMISCVFMMVPLGMKRDTGCSVSVSIYVSEIGSDAAHPGGMSADVAVAFTYQSYTDP